MSESSHAFNHSTGKCDWCGATRYSVPVNDVCLKRGEDIYAPQPEFQSIRGKIKPIFLKGMDQEMPEEETRLPFVASKLHGLADLFAERNAVYKDNFRMVGRIMVAMFPEGIELKTEEDHNKFHLFMLKIVKLSRYVVNYDQGHIDSIDDDIVYTAMVAALDEEARASRSENGQQA
jgi:hypothetical protein